MPSNSRPSLLSVVDLYNRISQSQMLHDDQEYLQPLKFRFAIGLCIFLPLLCFFECHNQIYNSWFGPFHFTRDDFVQQWDIYRGDVPTERSLLVGLLSFEKEYLHIELGENVIDTDRRYLFLVYFRHPTLNQLLYTFHRARASSTAPVPKSFLVKLPTVLTSHYHRRLDYRFERFTDETLMCILRQLAITYATDGFDPIKSNYIRAIEETYDRNATEFNMKVIQQCGIFLGYLYHIHSETVFHVSSERPYDLSAFGAAFDASSTYSAYFSWILFGVLFL